MTLRTPLEMFYERESNCPNDTYLRQPISGKYLEFTWSETGTYARKIATYLNSLELPKGSKIGILSKNCAHWIMTDLAIMMSGHVCVPLFPNLSAESLQQIIEHSEMRVLFLGKLDDFRSQKGAIPPELITISFPFYGPEGLFEWDKIVDGIEPIKGKALRDSSDLAVIMYTSGTTGQQKGVMHDFYNLGFAGEKYADLFQLQPGDRVLSHLPLCHAAERVFVHLHSLYSGLSITFVESLDTFMQNLKDTAPDFFGTVPRLWLKIHQGISKKIPPGMLSTLLSIPVLSALVKSAIKKKLGLHKSKIFIGGSAPISLALLEWYQALGIEIREIYAMTENMGYSHANLDTEFIAGMVGKPLPDCEVKLDKNGEVLVRHEALMKGYYKEPKLTYYSFTEDGFLKTGDKGEINKNGSLRIVGRIKDEFKTSKGKYVAPAPIENKLSGNELIDQVCVVGSGLAQPMALTVLSEQVNGNGDKVEQRLTSLLDEVNASLNPYERMWKLVVLSSPWTVENGYLTPTLKIKRQKIEECYAANFDSWSAEKQDIIWA